MQIKALNNRLAALYSTRQLDLLSRADAVGESVDQAVLKWWHGLWQSGRRPTVDYFRRLPVMIRTEMREGLLRLALWSHSRTAKLLADNLPLPWLQALVSTGGYSESVLTEDDFLGGDGPGIIELWLKSLGLNARDLAFHLRDSNGAFTPEEMRQLMQAILFPPPKEESVRAWIDRILPTDFTPKAGYSSPEQLASVFSLGYSQGKGIKEIASDIMPMVNNVGASARRVSRTWGMHVAHAVQDQSHAAVDDLTIGWQIRNPGDQNTRPEHRLRMGTIYYKNPKEGQKGLDEMPRPPLEADGTVAYNCRCFLTPVLSPPDWANDENRMAVFRDNASQIIPDTAVYQDWFSRAGEKERKLAVGVRRYNSAKELLGRDPDFAQFVDTKGGMLTIADMEGEDPKDRQARVNAVRQIMNQRRLDVNRIASFGFTTSM